MVVFRRHQQIVSAIVGGLWRGYYRKMHRRVFVYVFSYQFGVKYKPFYVNTESDAKQVFIDMIHGDT